MLREALIALAMLLSNGNAESRARAAVDAIEIVTAEVDATELYPELVGAPEEARNKLGRLLIAWSYWESSWIPDALGDQGRSCGVMQVMPRKGTPTCAEMRSSAVVGYRAGLSQIRALNKICNGLKPALGAYGSGKCGGLKKLVERRCSKSGGC